LGTERPPVIVVTGGHALCALAVTLEVELVVLVAERVAPAVVLVPVLVPDVDLDYRTYFPPSFEDASLATCRKKLVGVQPFLPATLVPVAPQALGISEALP
jgi:hypothetical protein